MRRRLRTAASAVAVHVLLLAVAGGGDWPQILGPHRNGIAEDERIVAAFPAKGPPTVWQRDVGSGFAGVAVADRRAVLFHRIAEEDLAECLDAQTGQVIWKVAFPARYVPSYTDDDGPRAVPVIHGGRVFLLSALGLLSAVDLKTGTRLWSRDTFEEYNSKRPLRGEPPEGYFGIGSTPLAVGELLLVNVGGDAKQAGIVAFSVKDGRTVWAATADRASYSSPVLATFHGRQQAVFATRFQVVSIDPQTGEERFRFAFGRPGPNVTAANPLILDGHVFVTASYGFGAVLARVEAGGVREVWRSDDLLSSQYTTCIEHEGKLYGIHGRQDVGAAELRCFDPFTQKVHWAQEGFGYATLLKADGKLLALTTDGELVLIGLDPAGYRELSRARILDRTARALPALSRGLLYARDTRTLKCVDLHRE